MKKDAAQSTQALLHHWREAVPDDRLAHLIRDVARAQMRALQDRLVEHNVSFGHWQFLRILWTKDGLTQRELSDLAGVMEPTTFTAVKAMESLGLIERRQLAGNRKNMHVFLTSQGRELRETLVPLAEDVNRISVEAMSDATISTVRRALLTMIENLAQEESLRHSKLSP
jgi:MarR family transcriptional regulator, organic hydroperoxide resistance regulator